MQILVNTGAVGSVVDPDSVDLDSLNPDPDQALQVNPVPDPDSWV